MNHGGGLVWYGKSWVCGCGRWFFNDDRAKAHDTLVENARRNQNHLLLDAPGRQW